MIHAIPEFEKELHTEDQFCVCEPIFKLDDESGEMIWFHQIIDLDRLVDSLIQI